MLGREEREEYQRDISLMTNIIGKIITLYFYPFTY